MPSLLPGVWRGILRPLPLALCVLYLLFFLWYTPLRGKLSEQEIDHYVAAMAQNSEVDDPAEARLQSETLRRFLEQDTGGDFVMINAIELRQPPLPVEGVAPGESAQQVLARYMEYMWPALLRRASHPVLFGSAWLPELRALTGDRGARDLLDREAANLTLVACEDPGVHRDIDTHSDF